MSYSSTIKMRATCTQPDCFVAFLVKQTDFEASRQSSPGCDVLMHVAAAGPGKEFPFDRPEVFLVPRGTLACLRPGVWHRAPYALGTEYVNCLIALPERTYMSDCKVHEFPAQRYIQTTGEGTNLSGCR